MELQAICEKIRSESLLTSRPPATMHLSVSSPRGGGGVRATHGNLTVTYIPRVGILI